MSELIVNVAKTEWNDIRITDSDGFPLIYMGRSSYCGGISLHSYHYSVPTEKVHLVYIGRYVSIADGLSIYCDMDHDYRSVYMGVIPDFAECEPEATAREKFGQVESRMPRRGMTVIGNDVWIGDNVTLISDVVIGNGAVIGAGSVVTHDIPPYTIWGGNPARKIKDRFPAELVSGLQQIAWWEYSKERIKTMESDMKGDVEDFVAKYLPEAVTLKRDKTVLGLPENAFIITMFLDLETEDAAFYNVIEAFTRGYADRSAVLVLCYYQYDKKAEAVIERINDLLAELTDVADISLFQVDEEDDEMIIAASDCLVLGRDIRNIQRIIYALKYDVKLISGVNRPVFGER